MSIHRVGYFSIECVGTTPSQWFDLIHKENSDDFKLLGINDLYDLRYLINEAIRRSEGERR